MTVSLTAIETIVSNGSGPPVSTFACAIAWCAPGPTTAPSVPKLEQQYPTVPKLEQQFLVGSGRAAQPQHSRSCSSSDSRSSDSRSSGSGGGLAWILRPSACTSTKQSFPTGTQSVVIRAI